MDTGAMFHGQGAGKDDKGIEREKVLRAVDAGVMKVLKDEKAPLVLACVDEYYPVYEKVKSVCGKLKAEIEQKPALVPGSTVHQCRFLSVLAEHT